MGTFGRWPATRRSYSRLLVPLAVSTAGHGVGTILLRAPQLSCSFKGGVRFYFETASDLWTIPFAVATRRCVRRSIFEADVISSEIPRRWEIVCHVLCWIIPLALLLPLVIQNRLVSYPGATLPCIIFKFHFDDKHGHFTYFYLYGLRYVALAYNT